MNNNYIYSKSLLHVSFLESPVAFSSIAVKWESSLESIKNMMCVESQKYHTIFCTRKL